MTCPAGRSGPRSTLDTRGGPPRLSVAEAGRYPDLVDRARKVPGALRMETSKVWPKEDGTPTPAYRMIDLYLPDYDTANAAVGTPEAAEFFPRAFELATGGARAVFAEIEES